MTSEGGGASRTTDPAAGSSAATDVSLREFLNVKIGYERETTRLLVGFASVVGAFAWSQIQRRLEILNHENARVATIAEKTVSSDTYRSDEGRRDDERDKLDGWRKEVDRDRSRSVTREEFTSDTKREKQTVNGQLIALVGAVAAAAGFVGHYLG